MITGNRNIIEEYCEADFNERLHFFLQFPELRSRFTAIDQHELQTKTAPPLKNGQRLRNWLGEICNRLVPEQG